MLRPALGAALLALALTPAAAAAAQSRAMIVFLPAAERASGADARPSTMHRLDLRPQLSLGLLGATQGAYRREQALLDMTQGTRVSRAAYDPTQPPELGLVVTSRGGRILGWDDAVSRADTAEATIVPGLLGASVPGGVGYVGAEGSPPTEAVVAADRRGAIAAVSLGSRRTIAARALAMLARKRLVVVALAAGGGGVRALDELLATRASDQLLLVVRTPPDRRAPQMLAMGAAGLRLPGGAPGNVTSATTRRDGIVAGIDVLPTVLRHLGLTVPDEVKGRPISVGYDRDGLGLARLDRRLAVLGPRRIPALQALLAGIAALGLALAVARGPAGRRRGLRIAGLAVMWVLPVLLFTATLAPRRSIELLLLPVLAITLAVLTDFLVRWPRAPVVPALASVIAYCADLFDHSSLIVRSLLGPNPRFGSRYYGIGNELEATLPVLLWVALAVLLMRLGRSRRSAWTFALAGLAFGAIIGSGRLGADVGGVVTVGAGAAAGTVLLLPGGPTKRAIALALAVPVLALAGLAGLDLATGGDSHFTRSVLEAKQGEDLLQTAERRYELAYNQLVRGAMPLLTAAALILLVLGIRRRERWLAPLRGSPSWTAAFGAGAASAVAGALFNDSGPLLLVFAMFVLLFALAYVRGAPAPLQVAADDPGR